MCKSLDASPFHQVQAQARLIYPQDSFVVSPQRGTVSGKLSASGELSNLIIMGGEYSTVRA